MGIPAAGIVDIDFVKDGSAEFSKALNAVGIPYTNTSVKTRGGKNVSKGTQEHQHERIKGIPEGMTVPTTKVNEWLTRNFIGSNS